MPMLVIVGLLAWAWACQMGIIVITILGTTVLYLTFTSTGQVEF
jgi:hypothetical protein